MLYKLNRPTALSLAAIALILGAIGPWITVLGVINMGPTNSTELAIVVFGSVALLIVSAVTGRFMRPVSILAGLAVLGESLNTLGKLISNDGEFSGLVTTGWGLYLSILAGLFLVVSTWVAKREG